MANTELDKMLRIPASWDSGIRLQPDLRLVNFRVSKGLLYLTEINRVETTLYSPSASLFDSLRVEDLVENSLMSDHEVESYIEDAGEEDGYPVFSLEEDFLELGGAPHYFIRQSVVSVDEIVKQAFLDMTDIPFSRRDAELSKLFSVPSNSESVHGYRPKLLTAFGGYAPDEPVAEWLSELKDHPQAIVEAVRDTFEEGRVSLAAGVEFLRQQEETLSSGIWFHVPDYRNNFSICTLDGKKITEKEFCLELCHLRGMEKLEELLKSDLNWGVEYHYNGGNKLLPTVNGKIYARKDEVYRSPRLSREPYHIQPEHLSMMLGGFVSHPDTLIFRFLFSLDGEQYREKIASVLPDAKTAFDRLVEEKLKSFAEPGGWALVVTGDKPHGLYLKNGNFIPLTELVSNEQVLHICRPASIPSTQGNGRIYESYTELVREGNRLFPCYGVEYDEVRTEDRIETYPSHKTVLRIEDNDKITGATICPGTKKDILFSESSDVRNPGMEPTSSCISEEHVNDAVFTAAVYKYRDTIRQYISAAN